MNKVGTSRNGALQANPLSEACQGPLTSLKAQDHTWAQPGTQRILSPVVKGFVKEISIHSTDVHAITHSGQSEIGLRATASDSYLHKGMGGCVPGHNWTYGTQTCRAGSEAMSLEEVHWASQTPSPGIQWALWGHSRLAGAQPFPAT